jgi:hypothetical protein
MLLTCWEDRLHEPLESVRAELGFKPPVKYREALRSLEGDQMISRSVAA